MVRLKSEDSRYGAEHKNYWKLGEVWMTSVRAKHMMKGRKFYCKRNEKKDRTMDLYYRSERGLLSYEACRRPELEGFLKARGVHFHRKDLKGDLIKTLEKADDDLIFEYFMDLPAELRNTVYEFHLEQLDVPQKAFQPPICLVSRQVRQETLPLFYSWRTLQFRVCYDCDFDAGVDNDHAWTVEARSDMTHVLTSLPTANEVAQFGKVEVHVAGWRWKGDGSILGPTSWAVDLSARRSELGRVSLLFSKQMRGPNGEQDAQTRLYLEWVSIVTAQLEAFAQGLRGNEIPRGFRSSDLEGLVKACSTIEEQQ